jgi:hypothetical protein
MRNNFCFTTFQNFECGWPRLGLKGRKKAKKVEIFQYFGDFFKNGSPKAKFLCLFDASMNSKYNKSRNFGLLASNLPKTSFRFLTFWEFFKIFETLTIFKFNLYFKSTTYQKFSFLAVQEDEICSFECWVSIFEETFFSQKCSYLIKCPGQTSH